MSLAEFVKQPSLRSLSQVFGGGPAKPGDAYGAPGTGKSTAISVITGIALLVVWWYVTERGLVKPLFLPAPQAIVDKFVELWTEGFGGATLWQHTWASLQRVFGAFLLACVTAIPVGIGMGMNRLVRGVFDPPIEFYRPIPPLAYLPLVIIWAGIGETAKILLIYLAVFAPMALNARAGVRSVSIEQIHAAYSLGASRTQIVAQVVLKAAMPEILTGMRIGIGFGWTTLVAAEMVAAEQGLGVMVLSAAEFLVTDVVVTGIVIIGVLAYLFDLLMRYVERLLVPWKGKV
ncbi:MAG: ABC transporter permease subunit [Alphaproteobacteria bacterium]